jgi:salicylate hydroxylase
VAESPGFTTLRILIVGAGIGGLTAALALLRDGHDVEVYEQASQLAELGAGVQISANGARVLFTLGLEDALRRVWCEPAGKEIRLWTTGETWKLFDLGAQSVARYGAPYFMIHRADLHQVLIDAVRARKPDAIRLNARVTSFEDDGTRVTLQLADGTRVNGDALIGADGVHSRIRQGLFGEDSPQFSGIIAWRGIVPMEKLPAHMARMVGTNWVGPGGHVVHYPLREGRLMNFVGALERSDWQVESWSARGTAAELAADFHGWHDDVHAIIRNISVPYKWALMVRPPMESWTLGRVTLLGDACHSMVPFLAQGAVMAIEDGFVLARAMTEGEGDIPRRLLRYEGARRERTRRAVEGSANNIQRFHNPALADPVKGREYVDREWAGQRVAERYEWLFRYDVTTVPV